MAAKKILCLFDVDGTLTLPRQSVEQPMISTLDQLRQTNVTLGVVGGSDLVKQLEQLTPEIWKTFAYSFSENGLIAYRSGELFHTQSFKDYLGEERLKKLINFVLHYLADLDIPIKRGTFIEFRSGMLNVSPIGRNCSIPERKEFLKYDMVHQVRAKMVKILQEEFADYGLRFSIGGEISFDVFPNGWDKTYCLQHLEADRFEEIHFFGDKTLPGENDYEIFTSPKVIGHSVKDPNHTIQLLNELFLAKK
eukprot:TRINITY_DN2220_c0_g1_i1.p1 TRINITY_DN2220_c0_g1~~TRINITY_DN2220_c0_g1_i1.p1  ORF type:complete len:279 (-),score=95.77 TRINITY_DN2220_c0_g1_i1:62-811(-)